MSDAEDVVAQTSHKQITIGAKITEIDFGYHHVNDSFIVYPGRY